jgi:hypothetical protein
LSYRAPQHLSRRPEGEASSETQPHDETLAGGQTVERLPQRLVAIELPCPDVVVVGRTEVVQLKRAAQDRSTETPPAAVPCGERSTRRQKSVATLRRRPVTGRLRLRPRSKNRNESVFCQPLSGSQLPRERVSQLHQIAGVSAGEREEVVRLWHTASVGDTVERPFTLKR